MFFLFCSNKDLEAIWLYDQIAYGNAAEAEILFVEDIYSCEDWHLRINDHKSFAGVKLPTGKEISTENVTKFLNRVNVVSHPFWEKKDLKENQYFQQEWNAFMLGWLKAFDPVLINKASPASLSGFSASTIKWAQIAFNAGFSINKLKFCSDNREDLDNTFFTKLSPLAESLLVYNRKVYCKLSLAGLSKKCLQLAIACNCNLLEVFVEKDSSGCYKFATASNFPAFSKYERNFVSEFRYSILSAQKDLLKSLIT